MLFLELGALGDEDIEWLDLTHLRTVLGKARVRLVSYLRERTCGRRYDTVRILLQLCVVIFGIRRIIFSSVY